MASFLVYWKGSFDYYINFNRCSRFLFSFICIFTFFNSHFVQLKLYPFSVNVTFPRVYFMVWWIACYILFWFIYYIISNDQHLWAFSSLDLYLFGLSFSNWKWELALGNILTLHTNVSINKKCFLVDGMIHSLLIILFF